MYTQHKNISILFFFCIGTSSHSIQPHFRWTIATMWDRAGLDWVSTVIAKPYFLFEVCRLMAEKPRFGKTAAIKSIQSQPAGKGAVFPMLWVMLQVINIFIIYELACSSCHYSHFCTNRGGRNPHTYLFSLLMEFDFTNVTSKQRRLLGLLLFVAIKNAHALLKRSF